MEDILVNLHEVHIITWKNVEDLRNYIYKKNPDYPTSKKSSILANSLNKIIENNMPDIGHDLKKDIKREVFQNAVKNGDFKIDADDILTSCLKVGQADEDYFNKLYLWIDERLEENLEKETTIKMLQNLSPATFNGNAKNTSKLDAYEIKALNASESISDKVIQEELSAPRGSYNKKTAITDLRKLVGAAVATAAIIIAGMVLTSKNADLTTVTNKKVTNKVLTVPVLHNKEVDSKNKNQYKYASARIKVIKYVPNNLDKVYQFHEINKIKFREYLANNNSLLGEEPYFSAINEVAEKYNINPVLLFAITAAEQSLVPKGNSNAKLIANNPFNVYHSWQEYNTNIYDSSSIAARTIINLCKNRPKEFDTIRWLNKEYSESQDWWISVKGCFKNLSYHS